MQLSKEELLEESIEEHDFKRFITLLKKSVNLDTIYDEDGVCFNLLEVAIDESLKTKSLKYVKVLLDYGADVNDQHPNTVLGNLAGNNHIELTQLLLEYGANVNLKIEENETTLYWAMNNNHLEEANLYFKYGAYATINKNNVGLPCFCTVLGICSYSLNKTRFLLNHGADTAIKDIDGTLPLDMLELKKDKCNTPKQYQHLQTLLNPNNPPYLKLGKNETDKYIIYENKDIETNPEPHILANKQKHPNKKYLYADNKSDAFVYWAYKNNLLAETLEKGIEEYISIVGEVTAKNIGQLMVSTIGDELTSDMFNEEGKPFAISYPTVTHWWYSLHTDFNRLYQDEDNRLPRAIKSQEEFDTLMKLLDIRYEQFKSGKDFNSNQNKAELQALIEGKEPPKREVDLSWLEEHCGEDGVSDNGTETGKSENNNANQDNIIPDDFFVKE